ncbi:hypothetical protein [Pedobacter sp.]|uniref:hypothetical protein n=1 Tax=Pedobacter sp. TaxID=1411316 RepID=UPI00396CCF2E
MKKPENKNKLKADTPLVSENKKKAMTSKEKDDTPRYTKDEKEFADGKGSQLSNQLDHKKSKGKEKK